MLNDLFDRVFLINLDYRKDRLDIADTWFKEHGIDYERWPAVEGSKLGPEYSHLNERQKAEVGCRTSHLQVIQEARYKQYDSILVLEDDFEPCVNFIEILQDRKDQLPDWEWLYFGGNHTESTWIVEGLPTWIHKVGKTSTTHAYSCKKGIYNLLIAALSLPLQADLCFHQIQGMVATYCFVPQIIGQRAGYSDIIGREVNYDFMNDYGK